MVWCEDNYYLIGVHEKYSNFSHYRVDRINQVNILDDNRKLAENMEDIDDFHVTEYIDSTFNVFTGIKEAVKLKFTNDLLNPIVDKFGLDAYIIPEDEEHSILVAEAIVSEGFNTIWRQNRFTRASRNKGANKGEDIELNKIYGGV